MTTILSAYLHIFSSIGALEVQMSVSLSVGRHFAFLAAIAALYLGLSLTDWLTHGATLGQSRAGQGRPHGNLTEPHGYLIGPNGTRLVDEKLDFFKTSRWKMIFVSKLVNENWLYVFKTNPQKVEFFEN